MKCNKTYLVLPLTCPTGILSLEGRGRQGVSFAPLREKVGGARMRGRLGGFTLIELLVVVLIIGILAAVAVPQYKKIILKQHITQMKTIAEQFIRAENLYRLENGNNTPDIDALAVKVPSDSSFYIYGVTDYKGLSTEYYTIVIRSLKYKDTYALVRFYKAYGYAGISWYGDDTVKKIANDL